MPDPPAMWADRGMPYSLMEQRIRPGKKLGRLPAVQDRLDFNRELNARMAEVVQQA